MQEILQPIKIYGIYIICYSERINHWEATYYEVLKAGLPKERIHKIMAMSTYTDDKKYRDDYHGLYNDLVASNILDGNARSLGLTKK